MKKIFVLSEQTLEFCSLKIIKIMRNLLILLFITALQVYAEDSYSQEAKLTLDLTNVSVEDVLNALENQSEFYFLCNKKLVDVERKVDIHMRNKNIDNILTSVFNGTDVDYLVMGRQIVLTPGNYLGSLVNMQVRNQQGKTIKGTVTDVTGEALPGVTIVVKGTTNGTTTDADGNYTLNNVSDDAILVFSFVGMQTEEVTVGTKSTIDLVMEEETYGLDEVVIIGYGAVKKSDLTGAVASVSEQDMTLGGSVVSAQKALQGRTAGVLVQSNSNEPGGSVSVRIRGSNSISSSNEPLYVIDGFPVSRETGLNLNPNDIESMQILKDASATAIYGARGANGVILISTKRGKERVLNVSYNGYTGVQNIVNPFDMLNGLQYMELANELHKEYPGQENEEYAVYTQSQLQTLADVNTNWVDVCTRPGKIQNHYLQATGGSDKLKIMSSLDYYSHLGVLKNTNLQRFTGRINVDQQINDFIKMGASLSAIHRESQFKYFGGYGWTSNVLGPILSYSPVIKPYNPDGTFGRPPGGRGDNPLANLMGRDNDLKEDNLLANMSLDIGPIKNLTARFMGGYETNHHFHGRYLKSSTYVGSIDNGKAHLVDYASSHQVYTSYLTYENEFSGIHSLSVMGGYSYDKFIAEHREMHNKGYPTDLFSYNNPDAGSIITGIAGDKYENILISSFGRLNYSFKDKYLFTFTLRYDGSSRFGEENRWGMFPSGAFAWRLSQEPFIMDMGVFSDLKLRLGYGKTGNDQIGNYASYALVNTTHYTFNQTTNVTGTHLSSSNPENKALKWETTSQYNVGLDMGFFEGRFSSTLDFYYKKTEDLLVRINLPRYSGFSSGQSNVGSMENKGFDLSVTSRNFIGDFRWSTTVNVSANRNKVIKITGEGDDIYFTTGLGGRYKEYAVIRGGESLGSLFGYIYLGVIQEGEEYGPQPLSVAGDPKFKDISGPEGEGPDGVITSADRTIIGSAYPDFIFGINNSFSYKNFDLSIFFHGSVGNDLFNFNRIIMERSITTDALDRWTPENTDTDIPRNGFQDIQYGSYTNTHFIEDASFIRLKNLTLGYTILENWNFVQSLRIYFMAEDLLTITDYTGWNPDVNTRGYESDSTMPTRLGGGPQSGIGGSTTSANGGAGLDWNSYPAMKTFTFGINVKF
ncbi:MAG: TonB-dependent receptor [Bacteroidota bacterium]